LVIETTGAADTGAPGEPFRAGSSNVLENRCGGGGAGKEISGTLTWAAPITSNPPEG
jgi:hypothetical protein